MNLKKRSQKFNLEIVSIFTLTKLFLYFHLLSNVTVFTTREFNYIQGQYEFIYIPIKCQPKMS